MWPFTKKPKIVVKKVKSTALTLNQWRQNTDLTTYAMSLHQDPRFEMLLQVLANESPVNYVREGDATQIIRALGRIDGYHMALNNLAAFSEPLVEKGEVEATFESPMKEVQ